MNRINKTNKNGRTIFSLAITVALVCLMTAVAIPGVMGAELDVPLGQATQFVILSYSGITDAIPASSVISGDVGTSPTTGASMNQITCAEVAGYSVYGVDAGYTGPVSCNQGTPPRQTRH